MFSALLHAINTMKNTIDDADYIVNWACFFIIFQYVMNLSHSHSIVNEPFFRFNINGLVVGVGGNTMLSNFLK
jgi:hypothetical protein